VILYFQHLLISGNIFIDSEFTRKSHGDDRDDHQQIIQIELETAKLPVVPLLLLTEEQWKWRMIYTNPESQSTFDLDLGLKDLRLVAPKLLTGRLVTKYTSPTRDFRSRGISFGNARVNRIPEFISLVDR
jgi:hypothetical protein